MYLERLAPNVATIVMDQWDLAALGIMLQAGAANEMCEKQRMDAERWSLAFRGLAAAAAGYGMVSGHAGEQAWADELTAVGLPAVPGSER